MKTATLKDVCQVSMGQAPDGASYNNSGEGFPLIAGAGDFGEHSPKPKKFTKEPTKLSQENDIVLCIRATIGDLNWSDKTYCLGRGVAGLRPKADKLNRQYLWHWLASQKDYLFSQGTGSTFKQISRATIDDLSIPLPPLSEQKRIAAILDKADSIRRKRQEAVRLAEELTSSAFLEMFGDPSTNSKGWCVDSLDKHISFLTTGSRGWAEHYSSEGSRFIRSLDVQMNFISNDEVTYVNAPSGAEANRTRVLSGDVLLTVTGSKIGRVAPVPNSVGEAYVSQHVAIIRTTNTLLPGYLSMFLSLPSGGQRQILKSQYGQTKPGLNLEQIRELKVPCPPTALQTQFVDYCERATGVNQQLENAKFSSKVLFNALLQRAFIGQL
jgi:type I restriction enzyme S subunit